MTEGYKPSQPSLSDELQRQVDRTVLADIYKHRAETGEYRTGDARTIIFLSLKYLPDKTVDETLSYVAENTGVTQIIKNDAKQFEGEIKDIYRTKKMKPQIGPQTAKEVVTHAYVVATNKGL